MTSGLDEQTDREMMNLFRSLADAGKTVVCITHSLANVERTCHLVVILTPGGKLAFVGKPAEALEYFGIERLGDVYERLAEQPRRALAAGVPAQPALPALRRPSALDGAAQRGRMPAPRPPGETVPPEACTAVPAPAVAADARGTCRSGAATTCRLLAMVGQAVVVACCSACCSATSSEPESDPRREHARAVRPST